MNIYIKTVKKVKILKNKNEYERWKTFGKKEKNKKRWNYN